MFIAFDVLDFRELEIYLTMREFRFVKMTSEILHGILVMECICRVVLCIFEAFWLQHGMNGRIGGATTGQSKMGLRVVHCRSITLVERPGESDLVLVTPGTDLGLPLALGRSVVKNLILSFFPIYFALIFFRLNRTIYDLIFNSIVVEDPCRVINNNRLHQQ